MPMDPPGTRLRMGCWGLRTWAQGQKESRGYQGLSLRMWLTVCHCVPHRSLLSSVYFLLLVFLEVPLLLSMLSVVLWVTRPQRGSGGWAESA